MFHRSLSKAKIRFKTDRDEICLLESKVILLSYSYNLYTLRQILHVAYVLVFQSCYTEEPQTQIRNFYFLTALEARVQNQGVSRAILPLKAQGNKGSLRPCLFPCFGCLPVILGSLPWICIMPICFHNYLAFIPACLHVIFCCPGVSVVKNPAAIQEMWVWSLGQEIPWRRNGNPLQYSCLENPMERGAWQAAVHGVAKSRTWLSNWAQHTRTHTHTHILELRPTLIQNDFILTNYMYKDHASK